MKYDLARMLKEIEAERRDRQPEGRRKLSQAEIRELIKKKKEKR